MEMQNRSICFITGQLGLGGAEKQLFLLVKGLISNNWRVTIITLNPGKDDFWEQPLSDLGIKIIGVDGGIFNIRRIYQITKYLCNLKPSVVHSWTIHANPYAAVSGYLAKIPVRLGSERSNPNLTIKSLGRIRYFLCVIGLDCLITNSSKAKEALHTLRPKTKVIVIKNGFDFDGIISKNESRQYLGIDDEGYTIVGIGSLVPQKGFSTFVNIARSVVNKYPSIHFYLIGNGPLFDQLLNEISSASLEDNFIMLGLIPNIGQYLSAFDILCFTSQGEEGLPNVLLEAIASGLPVIAHDVGGVSEIVEDGKNGFLVPPNDVARFVDCIETLNANPELRNSMGKYGKEKVSHCHNADLMVTKMQEVYNSFIQQKDLP